MAINVRINMFLIVVCIVFTESKLRYDTISEFDCVALCCFSDNCPGHRAEAQSIVGFSIGVRDRPAVH